MSEKNRNLNQEAQTYSCGPDMRILAVDDDEIILQLLEGALEAVGFPDVTLSPNPEDALMQLNRAAEPFDCFLLDIQMPVMDGIELCSRIRKLDPYRKTPVVMLTAMSDRDYIDRAFAAGATDYVTKPFDIVELGSRMRVAERLHHETRAAESSKSALDRMVESLHESQAYPLTEPVEIDDIDRFLAIQAFENYVATLGRGSYFASNVLALEVVNIHIINTRCTHRDFVYAITDFAEAISDSLTTSNGFFTYAGSGIFICIYNRVQNSLPDDFAVQVQDRIVQMGLVASDGRPMDPQIRCGSPVSPGFFSRPGNYDIVGQAISRLGHEAAPRRHGEARKILNFRG